jgi:hypothetical protein
MAWAKGALAKVKPGEQARVGNRTSSNLDLGGKSPMDREVLGLRGRRLVAESGGGWPGLRGGLPP